MRCRTTRMGHVLCLGVGETRRGYDLDFDFGFDSDFDDPGFDFDFGRQKKIAIDCSNDLDVLMRTLFSSECGFDVLDSESESESEIRFDYDVCSCVPSLSSFIRLAAQR